MTDTIDTNLALFAISRTSPRRTRREVPKFDIRLVLERLLLKGTSW